MKRLRLPTRKELKQSASKLHQQLDEHQGGYAEEILLYSMRELKRDPSITINRAIKRGFERWRKEQRAQGFSVEVTKNLHVVRPRISASFYTSPVLPSPQLAALVGQKPQPRAEIIKKVWDYIKKNKLQDPVEHRNIHADQLLQPVFSGKKTISMFEMAKHINKHIS